MNEAAVSSFSYPIHRGRRQLPIGLFEGDPTAAGRWTPAGKSQVDFWALSRDFGTVHLFELKAAGNAPLGMPQEAFRAAVDRRQAAFGNVRYAAQYGEG